MTTCPHVECDAAFSDALIRSDLYVLITTSKPTYKIPLGIVYSFLCGVWLKQLIHLPLARKSDQYRIDYVSLYILEFSSHSHTSPWGHSWREMRSSSLFCQDLKHLLPFLLGSIIFYLLDDLCLILEVSVSLAVCPLQVGLILCLCTNGVQFSSDLIVTTVRRQWSDLTTRS